MITAELKLRDMEDQNLELAEQLRSALSACDEARSTLITAESKLRDMEQENLELSHRVCQVADDLLRTKEELHQPSVRRSQAEANSMVLSEVHNLWNSRSWQLLRPLRNFVRKRQGHNKETEPIGLSQTEAIQTIVTIRQSLCWELTAPLRLVYRLLPRGQREAPAKRVALAAAESKLGERERQNAELAEVLQPAHQMGNDRTTYVIGLVGTGRGYIVNLMLQNIGERAKYLRENTNTIRCHPGPTSMIYSGHATIKHVSFAQELPAVTSRILEAVRLGFADLIFVYRHPLDSLLSNWIFWRTYIRDNNTVSRGISLDYKGTDDLCADLEQNFFEFKAFAEGDPDFLQGPRFLSFPEFVEETVLYLQSATLSLRLEDCTIDPLKEFSKIAKVMSVDLDLSRLSLAPPRAELYRYLAVKEKVPRFRNFINGLNAETKAQIEKIGYNL